MKEIVPYENLMAKTKKPYNDTQNFNLVHHLGSVCFELSEIVQRDTKSWHKSYGKQVEQNCACICKRNGSFL